MQPAVQPQRHKDAEEGSGLNALTRQIVDSAFHIHQALGPGLLESVYEDCMAYELSLRNIPFKRQMPISFQYKDKIFTNGLKPDFFVDNTVVVELKTVEKILPIHEAQILSYMRLTKAQCGLILNFNTPLMKQGIKRFVL